MVHCGINRLFFRLAISGEDLAERGPQETSSVVVETVHKVSKAHKGGAGVVLPHFKSNASLVTSKGMGLKKAYLGKQNLFSLSATDAGTYNDAPHTAAEWVAPVPTWFCNGGSSRLFSKEYSIGNPSVKI